MDPAFYCTKYRHPSGETKIPIKTTYKMGRFLIHFFEYETSSFS